jgi:hypothetical protein
MTAIPAKMLTIRKASREDSLQIARVHKSAVEAIDPGYYSPSRSVKNGGPVREGNLTTPVLT